MPRPIDHEELAEKLGSRSIVLLDAQAPGWFEREHLPGAHRVNWDDLVGTARAVVPDREAEVAVYCWNSTCTGSEVVAAELEKVGYGNVRRYVGGKQDWSAHGRPLVGSTD